MEEEEEVVANYFNCVQIVVNQMRINGESLTEVEIIEKILRTLTQRSKNVQREDDEAQMTAEDSDSDKVLLMATTKSDDDCLKQWYLDIGCSNHMTDHKDWFVSIDKKVKREIRFSDNSSVTVEGVGKVLIQMRDGTQSFICDVLYVPNMKNNLLSLGQLLEKGYSMKME
ncbi:uncharacterized protein [Cicer arietinum]|uniref:Uncharacterized protein LOC101514276 n=1 Tax=Cicer arietinum TaxID=3827 RepID=A0A1S3E6L2_CICAR|nr:uncharacterized protein LOC101514276 [Cicer arietinum]